jgi:hypothetical protein
MSVCALCGALGLDLIIAAAHQTPGYRLSERRKMHARCLLINLQSYEAAVNYPGFLARVRLCCVGVARMEKIMAARDRLDAAAKAGGR